MPDHRQTINGFGHEDATRAESPVDGCRRDGRQTARGRWIEGGVIVAFWGIMAALDVAQQAFDSHTGAPDGLGPGETLYTFLEYAPWIAATPLIFWLARRFSFERRGWPWHLFVHVAAAVTVAAGIDLSNHAMWNAIVQRDHRSVSLAAVLDGFHILPELLLYLVVLSAGFARDYLRRYRERVEEAARLRTEASELKAAAAALHAQLVEARFQTLRTQLNPHFLFNTLNTISSYLEEDPAGVRRMIARLSELLRYTLEKTESREVPLRQELGFIDGYLEIQLIRFDDSLVVHLDIDPAVLDALIPNLILQPLVENAIKHGIGRCEEGGTIELRAWRENERLHLSVRDTGPGLALTDGDGAPAGSAGIGLRNTRARLESLYGSDQRFTLEPSHDGGLVAHLDLPYHKTTDLYTTAFSE
jgi:two-component system, LytTR family, sensor kinase